MERIDDLKLFLRVLDLGSISAAARHLNLSVAVASQRLKRLEKSLGVQLFLRTTRRVQVTWEGTALAEQGRSLIEDLEALTGTLQRDAREIGGTLRVTLPASFGRQYISPLIPQFLCRHPKLKMHVDFADEWQDLISAGFDLAIRIGTLTDSSLVARRLMSNRRVLCAAPSYLRRYGVPHEPAELRDHECLLMVGRDGPRDTWRLLSADKQEIVVKVHGRLESNLGEAVRAAALEGLGIALHSVWHVCADLRAGRLQVVLPDYTLPESAIYAVTPQRRLVPARVRAFIDFVTEQFGPVPPWERHLNPRTKTSTRRR